MASRYSVIQYVPNPIADERINIGVLAFDEKNVRVHFLARWDRVRCFGTSEDISLVKNFANQMQKAASKGLLFPGDEPSEIPKHERLSKVARSWINSIQFTESCGSLEPVDDLLEDIVKTYLLEPPPKTVKLRDRQIAARITTSSIREVLLDRFGAEKAKELIRPDYKLKGDHQKHTFDITVANGRPILAAHGISFEIQTPESLLDALSWKILDVKESQPDFPLAIVALPPIRETPDRKRLKHVYEQTTDTYRSLGASVLNENQVEEWASKHLPTENN